MVLTGVVFDGGTFFSGGEDLAVIAACPPGTAFVLRTTGTVFGFSVSLPFALLDLTVLGEGFTGHSTIPKLNCSTGSQGWFFDLLGYF